MIKIVIADDSAFLRNVLSEILHATKKIKIVGFAKNGKEAIELVQELSPDILILDCEMPVMSGLEALRKIMATCPLPVFMFSSLTAEGSSVTLKALEYGAVDYLFKPSRNSPDISEVYRELIRKIECIASSGKFKNIHQRAPVKTEKILPDIKKSDIDLIAIGSSTGGVQAALEVIKRLPAKTKPIVWVQHMPENFTNQFAKRLNLASKITVKEAVNGDILKESTCYIAKGGLQMRVAKRENSYVLKLEGTEKVSGHCPSCDALFESISRHSSRNVLGVILTGMGNDGTKGLVSLHNKGAFVIGQNESSSIIYGMPKSAYLAGAVDIEVDICSIADVIAKKSGAQ